MNSRLLVRLVLASLLCAALSAPAFAQYGTGGTTTSGGSTGVYTAPKGGYSSATGAAIGGAAAAGLVVTYLVLHKTSLTGCVEQSSDGLKMMNEKDQKTYALDAGGADLKVGDKVQAKGKLTKDSTGSKILHVKAFKDLGSCSTAQAQAQTQ